jgi:hypothetical protein
LMIICKVIFLFYIDYATQSTIAITEAQKYATQTETMIRYYSFNVSEEKRNLSINFAHSIQYHLQSKKMSNKTFILHYFDSCYDLILGHFERHKKLNK